MTQYKKEHRAVFGKQNLGTDRTKQAEEKLLKMCLLKFPNCLGQELANIQATEDLLSISRNKNIVDDRYETLIANYIYIKNSSLSQT